MQILVDADACPVKEQIISIAKKHQIPVIMFIDTSHQLNDDYAEIIVVGQGSDAVDFALINKIKQNDMVITQDYGVATMALAKKAVAINHSGLRYTNENIDLLLFNRHLSQKIRRAGGKTINQKKRTKKDNHQFTISFDKLIDELLHKNC